MSTSKDADIERAKKMLCETLVARYQLDEAHVQTRLPIIGASGIARDIEAAVNAALTLGIGIGETLSR